MSEQPHDLTPEQDAMLKRLADGEIRLDDPGVKDVVGGLSRDDLMAWAARNGAQAARHQALGQAAHELGELLREHGCDTAGDLPEGVANPFDEVAARILRAHEDGELTDDELRELGIVGDTCSTSVVLVVHRTYANVPQEPPEDLATICSHAHHLAR